MLKQQLITIGIMIQSCLIHAQKSDSLEAFIEKKIEFNKTSDRGFQILLYNSNEEDALSLRENFSKDFKDIKTKLRFVSPDWKITTIAYPNKLEVEKVYTRIKKKYPSARIM